MWGQLTFPHATNCSNIWRHFCPRMIHFFRLLLSVDLHNANAMRPSKNIRGASQNAGTSLTFGDASLDDISSAKSIFPM